MTDIEKLEALAEELKKALTATTTSNLVSRERLVKTAPTFENPQDITNIKVLRTRGYAQAFEPCIIPTAIIEVIPEFAKSERSFTCESCGLVNKSQTCRSCSYAHNITEAKPFHLRK